MDITDHPAIQELIQIILDLRNAPEVTFKNTHIRVIGWDKYGDKVWYSDETPPPSLPVVFGWGKYVRSHSTFLYETAFPDFAFGVVTRIHTAHRDIIAGHLPSNLVTGSVGGLTIPTTPGSYPTRASLRKYIADKRNDAIMQEVSELTMKSLQPNLEFTF